MKQRLKKYWKNLTNILTKKELSILPGQLAFFFVVSIIPIVSLIFIAATWLNISYDSVTTFVDKAMSEDVSKIILPFISGKHFDFKLFIFILIAFIIATNAAHSIIITSNTVFNIPNSKFLPRRIKSIILTIILIFLMVFILLVPVFGQNILDLISLFEINSESFNVINNVLPYLKWPMTIFVIFFIIKVIYTIAPDAEIPSSFVNKGALFTTIFWVIATSVYSYYTGNIARYDIFYGSLANIIILMLWFYLMAYIFVIGLALNYRNLESYIEKTKEINLDEIKLERENKEEKENKKQKEEKKVKKKKG